MDPYYQDESVTLFHGSALDVTRAMPDGSVDCVVTSPPYFGLRDYGHEDQYGTEATPDEYIESMIGLYQEVRRVLTDEGTFWLNVGDSYGPRKNLLGIPWRVALALQDDGWTLRNDIIWAKPNAMPESVTDRLANRHEHLFLFTKSPRYWFDLDPIRKPHTSSPSRAGANALRGQKAIRKSGPNSGQYSEGGRNPGDVWDIATRPFPGAHFATFPEELPRRCIASGCKPGGVVLDPCSGTGTTGAAAQALGRRYIGIDINADYLKLSLETRLRNAPLDLNF